MPLNSTSGFYALELDGYYSGDGGRVQTTKIQLIFFDLFPKENSILPFNVSRFSRE
jgi:hypothetical protein